MLPPVPGHSAGSRKPKQVTRSELCEDTEQEPLKVTFALLGIICPEVSFSVGFLFLFLFFFFFLAWEIRTSMHQSLVSAFAPGSSQVDNLEDSASNL